MIKNVRKFKTERDIQNALLVLLKEKSFHEITIVDICNESLVGRSTFYDHYEDKYELLKKVVMKYTEIFQKNIQQNLTDWLNNQEDQIALKLNYGLEKDKDEIITLLTIHENNADLEENIKRIFSLEWEKYFTLSNQKSKLPENFMIFLETEIIMSLFKWTLIHGIDESIVDFSNDFRKLLLKK